MLDFVNIHAILDDYRRRTQLRRVTSGEKRVLSLRKEEQRLNGQKS